MKALSLLQPSASLVALNLKHYETRSWYTPYRGELAIHASASKKREDRERDEWLHNVCRVRGHSFPAFNALPRGAILCIVHLSDCVATDSGPNLSELEQFLGNFRTGRFAWKLDLLELFEKPIPAKGMLGLWNWERPA